MIIYDLLYPINENKKMKIFLFIVLLIPAICLAQPNGEQIFKLNCAACHSVGKGKLVGPDLEGVLNRRNEQWVSQFIKSSQSMVAKGDSSAIALFQEFNFIPMPDQPLSDEEITAVIEYIKKAPEKEVKKALYNPDEKLQVKAESKGGNWFSDFFFNPINWLIASILLLLLIVVSTLTKVIKDLVEVIVKSEKEKKELLKKIEDDK